MSVLLSCCQHREDASPYIGVDAACPRPAIFCIEHDPHRNKEGLIHQMMPLAQFKRSINEKKFRMSDKVAALTDQYAAYMDELIKEISQLKLRKIVELSMLWLRELASSEQQYENLRKIYRNDYEGLTCRDVHWLYFRVMGNQTLEKQKLDEIECYKDIWKVMETLMSSAKAKLMIVDKVMELEGIVQKGELLKRAMPDRRILRENTKEILLETPTPDNFEIKYNKLVLKQGSRHFQSVFSKYPLLEHTNYHLFIRSKYTNVLLGLCTDALRKSKSETADLHYSQHSITFNCSNGCLYRDGMFQSGSAHLTKAQKELELILRITDTEMLILLGKNVVCRTELGKFKEGKLFLHLLLRTDGDSVEIDRDKFVIMEDGQLVDPPRKEWQEKVDEDIEISEHAVEEDIRDTPQSYQSSSPQVNLRSTPEANLRNSPESNIRTTPESADLRITPQLNPRQTSQANLRTTPQVNLRQTPQTNLRTTPETPTLNLRGTPQPAIRIAAPPQPQNNFFADFFSKVIQSPQSKQPPNTKESIVFVQSQRSIGESIPLKESLPLRREPPLRPNIESMPMKESLFQMKRNELSQLINNVKSKESPSPGSSISMKQSFGLKQSIPLKDASSGNASKESKEVRRRASSKDVRSDKSNVFINIDHSVASQAEEVESKYNATSGFHALAGFDMQEHVEEEASESLLNPAVMAPLKKSQFDMSIRSSDANHLRTSPMPEIRVLTREVSGLTNTNGAALRFTENGLGQDWL